VAIGSVALSDRSEGLDSSKRGFEGLVHVVDQVAGKQLNAGRSRMGSPPWMVSVRESATHLSMRAEHLLPVKVGDVSRRRQGWVGKLEQSTGDSQQLRRAVGVFSFAA
jgi:hypothetical protein